MSIHVIFYAITCTFPLTHHHHIHTHRHQHPLLQHHSPIPPLSIPTPIQQRTPISTMYYCVMETFNFTNTFLDTISHCKNDIIWRLCCLPRTNTLYLGCALIHSFLIMQSTSPLSLFHKTPLLPNSFF